jgi:hypothetical protein
MLDNFPLQIKQINTRFKLFSIFTILWVLFTVTETILDYVYFTKNPSVIFSTIVFVVTLCYAIFSGMLTHGVFRHLKDKYKLDCNPTPIVIYSFLPILSSVFFPLEILKAYKILKLNISLAKTYLYYNIGVLIAYSIIFVFAISIALIDTINFTDNTRMVIFDILVLSMSVAITVFTWFIFKKIVDSIDMVEFQDDVSVDKDDSDLVIN